MRKDTLHTLGGSMNTRHKSYSNTGQNTQNQTMTTTKTDKTTNITIPKPYKTIRKQTRRPTKQRGGRLEPYENLTKPDDDTRKKNGKRQRQPSGTSSHQSTDYNKRKSKDKSDQKTTQERRGNAEYNQIHLQ